ncbi:hypothetical protein BACCAC_01668 [Bacteroides caccae ATCC 43185]|nr:hypothetical protein BACCAC_01668 [Bacteroides caccae ATCC 43185]
MGNSYRNYPNLQYRGKTIASVCQTQYYPDNQTLKHT